MRTDNLFPFDRIRSRSKDVRSRNARASSSAPRDDPVDRRVYRLPGPRLHGDLCTETERKLLQNAKRLLTTNTLLVATKLPAFLGTMSLNSFVDKHLRAMTTYPITLPK